MYREQPLYRLDFDDQAAFHHEVKAIAAVEVKAFAPQRNRDLTLNAKSTQAQLVRQAVLVGRLQQPGTDVTVDFDAGGDDLPSKFILYLFLCSSLFHICVFGGSRPEVASSPSQRLWPPFQGGTRRCPSG